MGCRCIRAAEQRPTLVEAPAPTDAASPQAVLQNLGLLRGGLQGSLWQASGKNPATAWTVRQAVGFVSGLPCSTHCLEGELARVSVPEGLVMYARPPAQLQPQIQRILLQFTLEFSQGFEWLNGGSLCGVTFGSLCCEWRWSRSGHPLLHLESEELNLALHNSAVSSRWRSGALAKATAHKLVLSLEPGEDTSTVHMCAWVNNQLLHSLSFDTRLPLCLEQVRIAAKHHPVPDALSQEQVTQMWVSLSNVELWGTGLPAIAPVHSNGVDGVYRIIREDLTVLFGAKEFLSTGPWALQALLESIPPVARLLLINSEPQPEQSRIALARVCTNSTQPIECMSTQPFASMYSARNAALEAVKTRFVLIINNDTVGVSKGWVESLVACMTERPEADVVVPMLLERSGSKNDVLHAGWDGLQVATDGKFKAHFDGTNTVLNQEQMRRKWLQPQLNQNHIEGERVRMSNQSLIALIKGGMQITAF